jgi:hypothetical protein
MEKVFIYNPSQLICSLNKFLTVKHVNNMKKDLLIKRIKKDFCYDTVLISKQRLIFSLWSGGE